MRTPYLIALAVVVGIVVGLVSAAPAAAAENDVPADRDVPADVGDMIGATVMGYSYCMTREATEILAKWTGEYGAKGYYTAMADRILPCYDARLHAPPRIALTLVEWLWDTERPDGPDIRFWRAVDAAGTEFYTWSIVGARKPPSMPMTV